MGERLAQPDRDPVGLPEILTKDVPQRRLQDRGGGARVFLLGRVGRRIGEETDDRLAFRLPSLFNTLALHRVGEAESDVLEP